MAPARAPLPTRRTVMRETVGTPANASSSVASSSMPEKSSGAFATAPASAAGASAAEEPPAAAAAAAAVVAIAAGKEARLQRSGSGSTAAAHAVGQITCGRSCNTHTHTCTHTGMAATRAGTPGWHGPARACHARVAMRGSFHPTRPAVATLPIPSPPHAPATPTRLPAARAARACVPAACGDCYCGCRAACRADRLHKLHRHRLQGGCRADTGRALLAALLLCEA
eukprot:35157-Chlamydomonas_euryale.AAC.3